MPKKSNIKARTKFNFDEKDVKNLEFIDPDEPTLTVPGQSLSMTEILNIYAKGQEAPVFPSNRRPTETGELPEEFDITMDRLTKMDKIGKTEFLHNIKKANEEEAKRIKLENERIAKEIKKLKATVEKAKSKDVNTVKDGKNDDNKV